MALSCTLGPFSAPGAPTGQTVNFGPGTFISTFSAHNQALSDHGYVWSFTPATGPPQGADPPTLASNAGSHSCGAHAAPGNPVGSSATFSCSWSVGSIPFGSRIHVRSYVKQPDSI